MRIRTIKPEFWTDSFMVQLPPLGRLLFVALWSASDDYGCIYDEPERLAMEIMPRENPLDVDHWLQLFWAAGKLSYCIADDGSTFWEIKSWSDHQRIDHPAKSKFPREGSRKVAIPLSVRRGVAEKYKCPPGKTVDADCYYCGAGGRVAWVLLSNGKPSAWVTFPGLELDHLEAEAEGGETIQENIVLACRKCNRSKADAAWFEHLFKVHGASLPEKLTKARDDSRSLAVEGKGKERKGVRAPETSLPEGFGLSARVIDWAEKNGFGHLQEHLDAFRLKAAAHDYRYADWDAALMNAIKADWARVNTKPTLVAVDKFAGAL